MVESSLLEGIKPVGGEGAREARCGFMIVDLCPLSGRRGCVWLSV